LLGAEPERAMRAGSQEAGAVGAAGGIMLPVDRAGVFVRRAVAIVAVLRANAVTVLRDFSGDPIGLGQCGDDVADELGLANAARVSADDDDARVALRFGHSGCRSLCSMGT